MYVDGMPQFFHPISINHQLDLKHLSSETALLDPPEWLNPADIGAIEVYRKLNVPAEFSPSNNCVVILVWTKAQLGIH